MSAAFWSGVSEALPRWQTGLWIVVVALVVLRLVNVGLEAWWRPLFPWDAWEIWGPKSKIWFHSRDLDNYHGHFDNGYPPGINLIQVWATLAIGTWDDARMNIFWPLMLAALGLGAYGQARQIGSSPLIAALVTYAIVSIPMLDTHAALAGYADLPLAVVYSLAAFSLCVWFVTGDWRQLVLAAGFGAMPPLFKIPGIIWSVSLVPAALLGFFDRAGKSRAVRGGIVLAVIVGASLAYLVARQRSFSLTMYQAHFQANEASSVVADNYLVLDHYHLLWYVLVVAVILRWRDAISRAMRPATLLVATGLVFLAVSFFFTNSAQWWGDYGTLNRATLHIVPLVVFYILLLARRSSFSWSTSTVPA